MLMGYQVYELQILVVIEKQSILRILYNINYVCSTGIYQTK